MKKITTEETLRIPVRLPAYILSALRGVTTQNPEAATTSDAITFILHDWLVGHGFLQAPPDEPEMVN